MPAGMRTSLLISVMWLVACGRTEPLRYTRDAGVRDAGATPEDDAGVPCVEGVLSVNPARPVVVLLVDRSASMNQNFPGMGGRSKWVTLRSALHDALPPWNDSLELGLQVFPSTVGGCSVAVGPELSPVLNNVDAVLDRLDSLSPNGSTPTAVAIESAGAALLSRRTADSAKALILATDGAPDCNPDLDPQTCTCLSGFRCTASRCLDASRTIGRITTLRESGVPTWVIGLRSSDDEVFVDTLNRMAYAGGRGQSSTQQFYSASSQQELEDAFAEIRRQVGACVYLTTSVPDEGGTLELRIAGDSVPYDQTATEGWAWTDERNGELAVYGEACRRAQAADISMVSVVVTCAR